MIKITLIYQEHVSFTSNCNPSQTYKLQCIQGYQYLIVLIISKDLNTPNIWSPIDNKTIVQWKIPFTNSTHKLPKSACWEEPIMHDADWIKPLVSRSLLLI